MHSKIFSKRSIVATTSLLFILLLFLSSSSSAQLNFSDNSVDQDSDVDSIANFGDDGSTSFTDASSFDGTNQNISEQNTGLSGFIQDGDWANYKDIIVNQGKINSDLTNFPMLVSIFDREVKNQAQADGDDIAFFDENGNQLPHELEIYNPNFNATHAQMVAWVKTDLTSNDDTVVRMKYGNSTMGSQQDSNNVWDNDFQAVYHLNNDPSQGLNSVSDSSKSNNDGTPSGSMVPADLVSGIIGDALDFDGSNDYIDLGNSNSLQITGTITVEAWFKGTTDIANDYLVSKGGTTGNRGWDLSFDQDISTDGWATFRYTDSTQGGHSVGYESVAIDTWYNLVGVFSPSNYERFYLNGVLISENPVSIPSSMYDSSVNVLIGTRDGVADYYEGLIDEVRISDISRSSDWISAQYNNQFDPNSFYTVTQEYYYDNPWTNYKYITIDGDKISSDLTDFPVLISLFDRDLKGVAKSSGDDIAFFDEFGSQLYHEIETYNENYNATHTQLVAWVKTDLAFATDKRLTMRYGGSTSLGTQENPELVWNGDYGGVWHLNNDPSTTIFDSTSNNNDGTSNAGVLLSDGKIGEGNEFTDGTNQYINIPDSVTMDFKTEFTIDVWVKPDVTNKWQTVLSKMNGSVGSNSTANQDVSFALDASGQVFIGLASSSNNVAWATGYFTTALQWERLTFSYDSSSSIGTLYVNGKYIKNNDFGLGLLRDNSNPFYLGYNRAFTNEVWDGVIDEVRISNIVRDSAWISTEFNNQNNPTAFYTVSQQLSYTQDWSYSKDLTIDNTLVSSDLEDFPVLVDIADSDLKTNAQVDGDDIAFFDEQGAQLYHEIELYDPNFNGTHAQLVAWVNVDLNDGVDTKLVMKYGNSTMPSQENLVGTWRNAYGNVWHLSGDPAGTSPQILDSTENNHGSSSGSMTSNDEVAGQIQEGIDFDGINDEINVGQIDSNSWSAVTMSVWVYKKDNGDDRVFSVAPTTATNDSRFALLMNAGNFATRIGTDGTGGTVSSTISGPTYNLNTWYYFVATWDSVTEMIYIYVDGVQVGSAAKDGDTISDTTAAGLIGNAAVGYDRFFNGIIDEVRTSYIARSLAWIETEFNNQNDPGAFISVGSQVTKLMFEDAVDDHNTNLDGVADKGNHSNFYDERSKDGIYDTLTESQGNTHTLDTTLNNDYVQIGGGSADWRSSQGTISFWINFNVLTGGRTWGLGGQMEFKSPDSDSISFDWGTSAAISSTTNLVASKWYFLALTWNDQTNTMIFYIGDENNAPTQDTNNTAWTSTVVGTSMSTNTFLTSQGGGEINGYGDELRYWDIERSQSDLQSDYNKLLNGTENGLRSYFRFDNELIDYGPDGNDATGVGSIPFSTLSKPIFDNDDSKLDLEVQFTNIPVEISTAELAIFTGFTPTENILVDYWNGTVWINLFTDLNPNSWNNISVIDYAKYETFTIRFRDGTQSSDLTQDTWQIDVVQLNLLNYQLDWEHQSQSIDTSRENYYLSVYGSTTDPFETFEIQLWDQVASQWISLATSISTIKQWYNITITNQITIGTTITWRYKGDKEFQDGVQGVLQIDYAGIASYDEVPVPISTPSNIPNYSEGISTPTLTWNFTDDNPNTYTIYRNDVPIVVDQPWTNAGAISISIGGLSKGSYNFTIEVVDDNNNPKTDQVDVVVNDVTAPIFDSKPSDVLYNETQTGNSLIWNSTDNYPNNYILYQNEAQIDSGFWTSATSITRNVDGLARGDYNFTLIVFDDDSLSVTDMVWVNVTDVTVPVFDAIPVDYQYNEGDTNNTITWNSTDLHESTFTLYRNDVAIQIDISWTNSTQISINIDGLVSGLYNFTLVVFDDSGNLVVDTVWITVNDIADPTFNSLPTSFPYSEGITTANLIWNPSDSNPDTYYIYRWDGIINSTIESGSWSDGVDISINIDGLSTGTYNYSIYVFDTLGNYNYNSVLITVVDVTNPSLDQPANITNYIEGSTGNSIIWIGSDSHPNALTIYRNDTFLFSTGWASGNIEWNIDGLELGVYNYTIVITDDSSNQAIDTVWVTVLDTTKPTIDNPMDVTYPTGSANNVIQWVGTDLHPDTYIILRNGTQVVGPSSWISQGTISINIDGLNIQVYNFTIIIIDSSGNSRNHTVTVEVTKESVFQSVPSDNVYYIVDDTGNSLGWIVSDVNPDNYIIYNNSIPIESGTWINEIEISINIDRLAIGTYNFSIFVNNTNGNYITHQLNVTVSDMPLFAAPFQGNITNYIEGSSGYTLTWNSTDLDPDTYTIYINGTVFGSYNGVSWDNATEIIVDIDGLSIGVYNFTIIIYDNPGNYITNTTWVTVWDTTNPTWDTQPSDINSPNYVEGSTIPTLIWNSTDKHPDYYIIYRSTLTINVTVGTNIWVNTTDITLDIGGLAKGEYNYTIYIFDTSGNYVSHRVFVNVTDATIPTFVTSPSDISTYIEGTSTPTLTWNSTDLYENNYIIYRNDSNINSGAWENATEISLGITGLKKGVYNFTIIVFDDSGNYNTHTLWVTVLDKTNPIFGVPQADLPNYVEGVTTATLSWDLTDLYEDTYTVYRNGEFFDSGTWTNGSTIDVNINGLPKGIHTFIITVYDKSGNFDTDTVVVTVSDETQPVFNTMPSDFPNYEEGTINGDRIWNSTDLYEANYVIYQNGSEIKSGTWTNANTISINIDGLKKGAYNYSIIIYDLSGNYNTHFIWITVNDKTDPTLLINPDDIMFSEGSTGPTINWNPIDLYEDNYTIYQNGSNVQSGTWTNASGISLDLDSLSLTKGYYNFTVYIEDVSGNTIFDFIWVNVTDTTLPSVDNPTNIIYIEGVTGSSITWTVSDTYRDTYVIYNNSIQVESGNYSGGSVTISVEGLSLGIYTFEIVLNDTSGNFVFDIVVVTVIEITAPTFDTPPQTYLEYAEGDPTLYNLTWNATDANPGTYLIYTWDGLTNTTMDSGTWTSAVLITINVDGLSKGLYNYSILIYDSSFNLLPQWVHVNVTDTTLPIVSDYSIDPSFESGSTGNTIYWNATDAYPDYYEIYLEGQLLSKLGSTGSWSTSSIVSFNVDEDFIGYTTSLGTHNFTIYFYDESGNSISHLIQVIIFDNTAPEYVPGPSTIIFAEFDTSTPLLYWIFIENNPNSYILYQNGVVVDTGFWFDEAPIIPFSLSSRNLDLNGPTFGSYNFTMLVTDSFGNTATNTIIVIVTDEINPQFLDNPSNITYFEGSEGNTLSWTMNDKYKDRVELYRNGTIVNSEDWVSIAAKEFPIDFLSTGVYNYTFVIYDASDNTNSSTVFVTVFDNTVPSPNSDAQLDEYIEGTLGNVLIWNIADLHPDFYEVYQDEILLESNTWVTDTDVVVNIDGYSAGNHNFTIFFFDKSLNSYNNTISIQVVDKTAPVIVNAQEDFVYNQGDANSYVSWNATDAHAGTWIILVDGGFRDQKSWESGVPIIIDFNDFDLSPDYYNFTIQILDEGDLLVTDTAIIRIRDPSVTDTQRPIIIIEKFVYEGDIDTINGKWSDIDGLSIDGATITVRLFYKSNDQGAFPVFTQSDGSYVIIFNYTDREPGDYEWRITFEKEDFQTWKDIFLEVTVLPHTYGITIDMSPDLVQGDSYLIVATIRYDNDHSNSTSDMNSLWLNEVTKKVGTAPNVKVKFEVMLFYEDGDTTKVISQSISNNIGIAVLTLSPAQTRGLDYIGSVNVTILDSILNNPIFVAAAIEDLPEVQPPQPTLIDQIIDFITANIIFLPVLIAGFMGAILVFIIFNRRRLDRIREINNNIKSALGEMRALNSIQSIIIQTSTKLTIYEEEVGSQGKLNTNLVGGMVTAFSSFLNEVGKNEQFGFEMMEREGVSITAHKGRYSNFIVISDEKLPIIMLTQIPLVQAEIERQYTNNFTNTSRGVKKLTGNQIYPIFNKIGFKVVLRSSLTFNQSNIRKLLKQRSLSRALKNNIRLLSAFPKSEYGKKPEIYLNDLMEYFKSKGITERISSRIIILGYQFKIITPRGAE